MVDTRKYLSNYISLADLEDGDRIEIITDVGETKFGRPELTFKSKAKFSVNNTNLRTMHAHYGTDDDNWLGIKIKLANGIAALTAQRFADVVTGKRLSLDNHGFYPGLDKVKGGS